MLYVAESETLETSWPPSTRAYIARAGGMDEHARQKSLGCREGSWRLLRRGRSSVTADGESSGDPSNLIQHGVLTLPGLGRVGRLAGMENGDGTRSSGTPPSVEKKPPQKQF